MKRIALVFALIASLLTGTVAIAAVKTGSTCTKLGATSTASGKKFTCIKSGKKLVWDKGELIKKPLISNSEIPTKTPTETQKPTTAREMDPRYPVQGQDCKPKSPDVVGYSLEGLFVDLMCNEWDNKYFPRPDNLKPFPVDPVTGKRLDTGVLLSQPLMQEIKQSTNWVPTTEIIGNPKSEISTSSSLANIDLCKIPDAGVKGDTPEFWQHHFVSGFSPYAERASLKRNPVIQFVTIDFPDLQGKASPKEDLIKVTDLLGKFWNSQSTNKLDLQFRIPDNYIRMPKNVLDYKLNVDFFSGLWKADDTFAYVKEAIKTADPYIDFTNADVIAIVVPKEVTRSQIGAFVAESSEARFANQGFQTDEKRMMNTLVMAGASSYSAYELLNWAHELGHNFGLTDLRYTKNVSSQDSSALGIYDLMNSMIAPELLAWNRFILGILNDDQVRCVTSGVTTHLLKPVEMTTNRPKLVVIPTGKYKAIAIESRRAIGFDANLGSLSEGVIVYEIDTTIEYGYSPMTLVSRVGSTDTQWRRDSALKVGDSVTTQGWRISVVESGDFGDVVKVEKVG